MPQPRNVNGTPVSLPTLKCPHCGTDDLRLIEQLPRVYLCNVCSKTWPRSVDVDVSGNEMDGP